MLTAGMDRGGRHALVLVWTVPGARRFEFPIELRPCVWTQARPVQRLWPNASHTRYERRSTEAMPRGLRSRDGRLLAHDHVPRPRPGTRTLMRTARERLAWRLKAFMFPFLLFLPLLQPSFFCSSVGFLLSPYFLFSSLLSSLHLHNSEASPLLVLSLSIFPSLTYSKNTNLVFSSPFPFLSLFGFIWEVWYFLSLRPAYSSEQKQNPK
ncbi:hypothetical protein HDV64DRAFT_181877 [Trichoderma sp. TUCIM 5745]